MSAPQIRTVRGDIAPEQLGICHMHEHLLGAPPAPYDAQDPDLVLDDEAAMRRELRFLHEAGGRALVEMTPIDYRRNPAGLQRLSEASDVHIIGVTGFLKDKFSASWVQHERVEALTARFVRDIEVGIDDTDVRAGVIKAASSKDVITDNERRVFAAAAQAHLQTGALISTHTEAGTMGLEQVDLLVSAGVHPSRILIGHCDRRLDFDYHLALLERGVCIGFDQISKEKYYPDALRIDFIKRLITRGFVRQLMLSCDLARRSSFPSSGTGGGPGFTFLLWRFIPWLRQSDVSEVDIQQMLVGNPARALPLALTST
jgi:phosphotriesterase-related protein